MTRITRTLATLALAILAPIGMLMTTSPADATAGRVHAGQSVRLDAPIAPHIRHAKRIVDVDYVRHGRAVVTFRDGSRWNFAPCRYEDSRNCHWNAAKRGNHVGRSLVDLRGHVHYVR